MDSDFAYDQYPGVGDVAVPREIEVETATGVKGTISVPHSVDEEDFLRLGYAPPTRKMVLILHGQGGHRNYCYHRKLAHKLAAELGVYSLRIDFRGCGSLSDVEDPNKGRVLELDVEDIQEMAELVVSAAKNPLNMAFDLLAIVAHSRGSLAMFLWALKQDELLKSPKTADQAILVPSLVNCLLRFRSKTVLDRFPIFDHGFQNMEQTALRHGKMQKLRIMREELRSLSAVNTAQFSRLSPKWAVLSIYGTEDTVIPKEDSAGFANALNRGPYTHHLELIDGADHNFYGVEPVENDGDMDEFNPHGLPLLKHGVVNYNYVVCNLVVQYLRHDQELRRFYALNENNTMSQFKTVEGISNFRDLGGWPVYKPTFNNHKNTDVYVKNGWLFRCANPAHITSHGVEALQSLGITTIYDLRSEEECTNDGVPQGMDAAGIRRMHVPVFRHEDYSPDAIALRFAHLITSWHTYVQIYRQMLDSGVELFRQMFIHIRDRPNEPMVFHCTAGKDRTGVFGMLVLRLAGVDRLTVAREYALTTYGLVPDHEVIRQKFLAGVRRMNENPQGQALEQMISQGRENWLVEVDGFNNLISLRTEAMLATMDLLDSDYGGIVNYMKHHLRFSKAEIETIFNNIVCTRPTHPDGPVRSSKI